MKYVAIIGPGESAGSGEVSAARAVAGLAAKQGWIVLTGGRAAGVMAAAAEGARSAGGMCIGLLPDTDRSRAAPELSVALATGLGEARNAVLVTAADAVVACGVSAGTLSEIALAIHAGKPVALLCVATGLANALQRLGGSVTVARDAGDAVRQLEFLWQAG